MDQFGSVIVKSRSVGRKVFLKMAACEAIKNGKSIFIPSREDNGFGTHIGKSVKSTTLIDVTVKKVTRLEPTNNRRIVFDESGEPVDFEILPQTEVFIGWKIEPKKIASQT